MWQAPGDGAARASVRVHELQLQRCGVLRPSYPPHPSHASRPPRPSRASRLYRSATLALVALYLAQECVYAYQERADMDKLARVMFLLLCHVTSIAKQLVFYREASAAHIDALLAGLDGALYARAGAAGAALRARTGRLAGRFARLYAGAAVLTCTLWITFPVLAHLRRQPVDFPFWVPIECSGSLRFALVLGYSYYVTTLVGIANTTMDAFIATILLQCKTQLTILRLCLEALPVEARTRAAHSGERYEAAFGALFRENLQHYDKIAHDILLLQKIFGTAILVQFSIGGFILCMAAYKIVSLSILSIEFASMTIFICCILTELFLYCYFGNEVTFESSQLVSSMYCMEWVSLPPRLRRSLLTPMERAKRPLRPAAGHVVPLSLDSFIKIIKFSYSFYAVLRQTK